jgi:heat shock protein 5
MARLRLLPAVWATVSCLAFSAGKRLIGATMYPENTIFDIKLLIGRKFTDKDVQFDKERLPCTVINQDTKHNVQVLVKG